MKTILTRFVTHGSMDDCQV